MFTLITKRSRIGIILLAAACGGDTTTGFGEPARIKVQITDAPADDIESAVVWVSRVYLQPGSVSDGADGEATRVDLFNDSENPRSFDLMLLQAGAVADLSEPIIVPEGQYSQLRVLVDSAFVTLKEGLTFDDGTMTRSLKIPSGSSSGIKVKLNEDLFAIEGSQVTLLVDMDVEANFKYQGPANNPRGMIFTPVLMEKNRTESDGG